MVYIKILQIRVYYVYRRKAIIYPKLIPMLIEQSPYKGGWIHMFKWLKSLFHWKLSTRCPTRYFSYEHMSSFQSPLSFHLILVGWERDSLIRWIMILLKIPWMEPNHDLTWYNPYCWWTNNKKTLNHTQSHYIPMNHQLQTDIYCRWSCNPSQKNPLANVLLLTCTLKSMKESWLSGSTVKAITPEWCGQNHILVGGFNPSEKWVRQLGLFFPIYGKS